MVPCIHGCAVTVCKPNESACAGDRPFLVAAHPGHELRLFHWMETQHPVVFLLTDGSGGASQSRTAFSVACCRAAGAVPGSVFGTLPDRTWYAAILAADPRPFLAAASEMIDAGARRRPGIVVSDAVEGYNPMHDLCAALGARVATALGVPHLTQAVTGGALGAVRACLALDAAAQARKRDAALAYAPLTEEVGALLAADPAAWASETLLTQGIAWPDDCDAAYERIGRERVAAGRYATPITYRHHVLAIARRLLRPD